jgi:uncharacterized protein with NAD-binding domain and iron-sulfur cluster
VERSSHAGGYTRTSASCGIEAPSAVDSASLIGGGVRLPGGDGRDGVSRRRFLAGAGAASVAAADLLAQPALAGRRRRRARPTVAVFGGGVAGLTAAHELAELGFGVTVYERRAWGGKARSLPVPRSGTGGRRPLPAEHGFRVVFGSYQNLPDTLRRIPFGSNGDGVFGNLVEIPTTMLARDRGRPPVVYPSGGLDPTAWTLEQGIDMLEAALTWLPAPDLAHLLTRLVVFFSSGQARRLGQWEYRTWADFVQADQLSEDGQLVVVNYPTRFIVQSQAGQTSARTIGSGFESTIYFAATGREPTRVLDAPTNEVWIDPWLQHLARRGVKLRKGYRVTALRTRGGKISYARVRGPRGPESVQADWYVVALPVDWATKLWTRDILAADPRLARSFDITCGWMTGIQLYLREPTPITPGSVVCLDSPWAIFGASQAQFWDRDIAADYGDGTVRDKFSALIVDWDTPGVLYGKPARDCTRDEIANEVWAQFKAHFTYRRAPRISDDLLAGTFLDPGIRFRDGRIIRNDDPLPRNYPGTWDDKPEVAGRIRNMFLAGDYVKVDFDISSMEGANEAARRAVNALLDRAGSSRRVDVHAGWLPPEWEAFRKLDDERYAAGQPNVFDGGLSLAEIRNVLSSPAPERAAAALRS